MEYMEASNQTDKQEFIKDVHYYLEEGRVVFTALQHKERGYCCGNNCRHCCYDPSIKGNTKLKEKYEKDNQGSNK